LLHGVPGSGKTSTVKAIASKYKKNIAVLEFDSDMNDRSLKSCIKRLPQNTILLIEDIDCIFQKRTSSNEGQITFSGLLNALDGVVENDETIIIMTSNHIKDLDFALKRRIDYLVEYTYAKKNEIQKMFYKFYPSKNFDDFYAQICTKQVTLSSLQKYFMKYISGIPEVIENDFDDYLQCQDGTCDALYT
jgi:SpoVK/Ycf46/Vps4 family AAA+-type ATPase